MPKRRRHRDTNDQRSFYNRKAWRVLSRELRAKVDYCERCGDDRLGIKLHVHHKKKWVEGGEKYDRENLQVLCVPCHNVLTRQQETGKVEPEPGCLKGHPVDYCLSSNSCKCGKSQMTID